MFNGSFRWDGVSAKIENGSAIGFADTMSFTTELPIRAISLFAQTGVLRTKESRRQVYPSK